VAVDGSGNIYVGDTFNGTVRKIAPDGTVNTLAGSPAGTGGSDGQGSAALFFLPLGVAADSAGNVYVADAYNATIRRITPDGTVTTLAGMAQARGSTDATGSAAYFYKP
jgi:sugar lactone lactonase YvrE